METSAPDKLTYTIASGPIPVSSHLGNVSFEALSETVTKVRWTVELKPYW